MVAVAGQQLMQQPPEMSAVAPTTAANGNGTPGPNEDGGDATPPPTAPTSISGNGAIVAANGSSTVAGNGTATGGNAASVVVVAGNGSLAGNGSVAGNGAVATGNGSAVEINNNGNYCANSGGCPTQYGEYPNYPINKTMDHPRGPPRNHYGPVTVPMMSNPNVRRRPLPMPVAVPPGHVLQQIVDENGTLRHVIIATNAMQMPPPPPPLPMMVPQNQPYYPYVNHGVPMIHMPHKQVVNHGMSGVPGMPNHPVPSYHNKDERSQRQHQKLKKKLYQKQDNPCGSSASGSPGPCSSASHSDRGPGSASPSVVSEVTNGARTPVMDESGQENGTDDSPRTNSPAASDDSPKSVVHKHKLRIKETIDGPEIVELTSRSLMVKWSQPDVEKVDENGTSIIPPSEVPGSFKYQVLLSDKGKYKEGKYKCIYTGSALSCRIEDLRPAAEYSVRLQASVDGSSLSSGPSEPTILTTPACEPDKPAAPTLATRTKNTLHLKWVGSNDNGSKILNFQLESDEGKDEGIFVAVQVSRARHYLYSNLKPSTCYTFRLAAINEFGFSAYSDLVSYYTCGVIPKVPDSPVLVKAGCNWLHIAWAGPFPEIKTYCLQMNDRETGHGFLNSYHGPSTEFIVQNLRRYTDYDFRLKCGNEEGESQPSVVVTFKTLAMKPSAPTKLSLRKAPSAHRLLLKWQPPADDGGATISKYTLEMSPDTGDTNTIEYKETYSGPAMEYSCEHLTAGTKYLFRICCESVGGRSEYSPSLPAITEPVAPNACNPPVLHGKPRQNSVALKWSVPSYNGGAEILESEVKIKQFRVDHERIVYKGKQYDCVIGDLAPGHQYSVYVRAYNRVGSGDWSAPLDVKTAPGVPSVPAAPELHCKTPSTAFATWKAPLTNGSPITQYRLDMRMNGADTDPFNTIYQGAAAFYEVKQLTAATWYHFRLQAANSVGWSACSPVTSILSACTPPSTIHGLQYDSTCTDAKVYWAQPDENGSKVLQYRAEVFCGDRTIHAVTLTERELHITNLTPSTSYKVYVSAENSCGWGAKSSALKIMTKSLPPQPPQLEYIHVSHNCVKLKWCYIGKLPKNHNLHYTLYMAGPNCPISEPGQVVYHGTSLNCKVNRLQEQSEYRFCIAASNSSGKGPLSEPLICKTLISPPAIMRAPRVIQMAPGSCAVEWSPTPNRNGQNDIILYCVQIARLRTQQFRQVYRGPDTRVEIHDLETRAEYSIRACSVRRTENGDETNGPYSNPVAFSVPAAHHSKSSNGDEAGFAKRDPALMKLEEEQKNDALMTKYSWGILLALMLVGIVITWLFQHYYLEQ